MKKIFCYFIFSLLSLMTLLAKSGLLIIKQTCEYRVNPIGLDVISPRFSWELADGKSETGQYQTAYRILVASSLENLNKNKGDMWDSKKCASGQSALLEYAGKALQSNGTYYWKVRIYDKKGRVADWSAPSRFSMGLLHDSDWKARWIKHPIAAAEEHIWYRKNFELPDSCKKAFIYVASFGYHELYVNGEKVDDRVLAPALARLDKRVFYVAYDVAALLKKGRNTIALWTGPGWARYEYFIDKVTPALAVQLNGKYVSGDEFLFTSSSDWKCCESGSKNIGGCKYRDNGGEYIDARLSVNWNATDYDDSHWIKTQEVETEVKLSAQKSEPTRIIDTIAAKAIIDTIPGMYKVDMGINYTGWIQIKVKGSRRNDRIDIYVADDPVNMQDFTQHSVYISGGRQDEVFCNRFNYIAGRYITIKGLREKLELKDITGYALGTYLRRTGKFTCSNELFNKIYETDLWTFRMCTTEGYTSDCPHRERLGYGEELFATAWGIALPNYDATAYLYELIEKWTDMQEPDGWIHHTTPQINRHAGGPMWCSAGLNIAWEYYQTYGDKRVLARVYGTATKWLKFLSAHTKEGILHPYKEGRMNFLGDWGTPEGMKEWAYTPEALFFNNCVYLMNLRTLAEIASILGKREDEEKYRLLLDTTKKRMHEFFYDAVAGIYPKGLQVPTAFALWQQVVPEELRSKVQAHFEEEIMQTHPYLGMGSSGLPVLMKYLTEVHPYDEVVAKHLNKTNKPSYGYFLSEGETTWPEYWSCDVPSKIHTCYTGVSVWFIKRVGGIRPDAKQPGYQSFIISPSPVKALTFADTEVETLYGTVKSNWRKEGNKFILFVSIPVNTKATVRLPDSSEVQVESGTYTFECIL